ncbi:MAG TPA: hypothetical protein VKE94_09675 [Gemmataceae bacterium]|nr:hypothetical protein [Gemmataceae bacterium]
MSDATPQIEMFEITDPNEIAKARAMHEQFQRNWDWLEAHASDVYSHRGKFICIAGQQLFVGDSIDEVLAGAKAAHPEDVGRLTRYIPKERGLRIYAYRGIVAGV